MIRITRTKSTRIDRSLQKVNLGAPKRLPAINPKIYLYLATGSNLSPNINNLRFYNSGLIYAPTNAPIYYDETDTYGLYLGASLAQPTDPPTYQYQFYIYILSTNSRKWVRTSNNINGILGNYNKQFLSDAVGTVTISSI